MLLNGFDLDTATGTRQVELRVGDLPTLGLDVDLVVVSAFEGDVEPVAGTLLGRLQQAYGIRLDRLACALDLRQSPLKCWVSDPIDWAECRPRRQAIRPRRASSASLWTTGLHYWWALRGNPKWIHAGCILVGQPAAMAKTLTLKNLPDALHAWLRRILIEIDARMERSRCRSS